MVFLLLFVVTTALRYFYVHRLRLSLVSWLDIRKLSITDWLPYIAYFAILCGNGACGVAIKIHFTHNIITLILIRIIILLMSINYFTLRCKYQTVYGISSSCFLCLSEVSVARCRDSVLFLLSAEYSVVMYGPWPGTLVTWPCLRLSITYYRALRPCSQVCVTCRSYWFRDLVALSCCAGARCLMPEGWLDTYEMVTEHFANQIWVRLFRNAGF